MEEIPMKIPTRLLVALAVCACAASPALAVLTFELDEAAFNASLANPVAEDFAAFATPGGPDVPIPLSGGPAVFGPLILTPMGTEAGLGELEIRAASSSEPATENSLFGFLDGTPDDFSFSIEFVDGPLNAFGANYTSAASLGGSTVSLDTGDSFDMINQLGSPGTGFLGFYSDTPFTTITFSVTDKQSFEGTFIEDVVGDVVPEPASALLLLLGAAAAIRRR
jgi:hypothetical protein